MVDVKRKPDPTFLIAGSDEAGAVAMMLRCICPTIMQAEHRTGSVVSANWLNLMHDTTMSKARYA